MNIKLKLRKGQHYTGPIGNGQMQATIADAIAKLVVGDIDPTPQDIVEESSITFRVTEDVNKQLLRIAKKKGISLQELLRLTLEELNLVTRP